MRLHERFQWDEPKALDNLRKHGVSFKAAALVLGDEDGDIFHLEKFDDEHSDLEDRWKTTAPVPDDRSVLVQIVWTERMDDEGDVTRIISARYATAAERREYENQIRQG